MAEKGKQLIADLAIRRSIYHLGPKLPISQEACTKLIFDAARQCPSGYNSQGSRLMILYGAEHKKLWEFLRAAFQKMDLPDEMRKASIEKLDTSFVPAAGTVLFFEDWAVVTDLQKKLPRYAEHFPDFAQQNHGITMYAVWCTLAAAGVGANIQHYAQLFEKEAKAAFDVPDSWKMIAQMPFGQILKPREDEVQRVPDSTRFVVRGQL